MQVLANFLSTPLASGLDGDLIGWPYVAFDLNPSVVKVEMGYALIALMFCFVKTHGAIFNSLSQIFSIRD